MTENAPPAICQINLIVSDMDASLAFYRRLGLEVDREAGGVHAEIDLMPGMTLELDTSDSVRLWDSGYAGGTGGTTILGLHLTTREAVNGLYADLVAAGHRGRQRPFDAFFGARYAIVDDPDGNGVGLTSPLDDARRFWPPTPPPKG